MDMEFAGALCRMGVSNHGCNVELVVCHRLEGLRGCWMEYLLSSRHSCISWLLHLGIIGGDCLRHGLIAGSGYSCNFVRVGDTCDCNCLSLLHLADGTYSHGS